VSLDLGKPTFTLRGTPVRYISRTQAGKHLFETEGGQIIIVNKDGESQRGKTRVTNTPEYKYGGEVATTLPSVGTLVYITRYSTTSGKRKIVPGIVTQTHGRGGVDVEFLDNYREDGKATARVLGYQVKRSLAEVEEQVLAINKELQEVKARQNQGQLKRVPAQ
jgi:hypothetical protein